jgi:predicted alpha/beta-fold hydrolase
MSESLTTIRPFRERLPWWGGDLQTLATGLLPGPKDVAPYASRPLPLRLADGDEMLAMLDTPEESKPDQPLVMLIHGLPGSASSTYMVRMSRYLLMQGHHVVRLNLRGAGASRATCKKQYYAGSSGDIAEVLSLLPDHLKEHGIAAVGYSLGGAILLKYLGEAGSTSKICAAATVSAPIDLLDICRRLMSLRNIFYHEYVLRLAKREATAEGADLTELERINIRASATLMEYDDLFTAPRNNYSGALAYYAACSALNFLPAIRVPTLLLASLDDPWVPGAAYSSYYWRSNPSLKLDPRLCEHGGHVGFHGIGDTRPWRDLVVADFLARSS